MEMIELEAPLSHPSEYLPHIDVQGVPEKGAKFVSIKPVVMGEEFPMFCDYCGTDEMSVSRAKELVAVQACNYILGYFAGKSEGSE